MIKQFKNWLVEMDQQAPPPANGGINPSVPPDISQEISQMAQQLSEVNNKMLELLSKLGLGQQKDDNDAPLGMEKGIPQDNAKLQMNSGPQ
jgi:hypothetical protein